MNINHQRNCPDMKKLIYFLLFGWSLLPQTADSQCPFDPVITGDTILCPNSSGILKTQVFDSYQWYRRGWGSSVTEPVAGATGQTLEVTQDDIIYYFSVEATLNGCKESSPEILLDGYAFLFPFVQHTGEYTFDPNTETFKVCEGDTMFLTLGLPYDTNITWFKDGAPIPGENAATLAITETGSYTVEGAPSVCPNYIQPLGLLLPVLVEPCATDVGPEPDETRFRIYPNPASDFLTVAIKGNKPVEQVKLMDASGRLVGKWKTERTDSITISLEEVKAGFYFLEIISGNRSTIYKITKN